MSTPVNYKYLVRLSVGGLGSTPIHDLRIRDPLHVHLPVGVAQGFTPPERFTALQLAVTVRTLQHVGLTVYLQHFADSSAIDLPLSVRTFSDLDFNALASVSTIPSDATWQESEALLSALLDDDLDAHEAASAA